MHSEKENEIPRTKSFKENVCRYILIYAKRVSTCEERKSANSKIRIDYREGKPDLDKTLSFPGLRS